MEAAWRKDLIMDAKDLRIDQKLLAFELPETVVIHHEDAEWVSLMRGSLRLALSRAEKAETQLCRAREATNQPIIGDNWTRVISSVLHIIAPGNSSPSCHAAIAERVEDTVYIVSLIQRHPSDSFSSARAIQKFLRGEGK